MEAEGQPHAEVMDTGAFKDGGASSSATVQAVSPAKSKKKAAKEADPSQGFVSVLSSKIEELEKSMSSGSAGEREVVKARKKQLREVTKFVADKSNTIESKIEFLQAKYTAMVTEFLKTEKQLQEAQAKADLVARERDKAQAELRRSNVMQDKLQELCRQLQKDNKEVLEEARRVREEDAAARSALHAKFQAAITDVNAKMDAQAADRAAQLAENDSLRAKLGDALQQFEMFNQLLQKKDLEVELAVKQLEQQKAINEALAKKAELQEQAIEQLSGAQRSLISDMESLIEAKQQNAVLLAANRELKEQLESSYKRFGEFQEVIANSNQTFDRLKKELDSGVKTRATLARERDELKSRCHAADASIAVLQTDQVALQKQVERLTALVTAVEGVDAEEVKRLRSQKEALEGLCRTLTAQVKALKAGAGASAGSTGGGSGMGQHEEGVQEQAEAAQDSSSSRGDAAGSGDRSGASQQEEGTADAESSGSTDAAAATRAEDAGADGQAGLLTRLPEGMHLPDSL